MSFTDNLTQNQNFRVADLLCEEVFIFIILHKSKGL